MPPEVKRPQLKTFHASVRALEYLLRERRAEGAEVLFEEDIISFVESEGLTFGYDPNGGNRVLRDPKFHLRLLERQGFLEIIEDETVIDGEKPPYVVRFTQSPGQNTIPQ